MQKRTLVFREMARDAQASANGLGLLRSRSSRNTRKHVHEPQRLRQQAGVLAAHQRRGHELPRVLALRQFWEPAEAV